MDRIMFKLGAVALAYQAARGFGMNRRQSLVTGFCATRTGTPSDWKAYQKSMSDEVTRLAEARR